MTSLEIPLKDGEEVIEIPFDDLPEASEILQILQQVNNTTWRIQDYKWGRFFLIVVDIY